MKHRRSLVLIVAASCFIFCGCASFRARAPLEGGQPIATRNNCYSLLHQLLDEEKDISKLRFIKSENADLKQLLKNVAAAAATGAGQLEQFAKKDPSLVLDDYALPPGEQKTRDSISKMEEKEILHHSRDELEMIVLLTQIESMNYGSHLAKVAAENDAEPERARYLERLSAQMKMLHDQIFERLTLRKPVPANQ